MSAMTDRELLELAAKAAKLGNGWLEGWRFTGTGDKEAFYIGAGRSERGITLTKKWNPLEDDGDRYRLIKSLKINIDCEDQCAWKRLANGELLQEFWHEQGDNADPECGDEAHAVLRVAAEIGRAMP